MGAPKAAPAGGFAFGSASQFGGMGSGAGQFGANSGGTFGSGSGGFTAGSGGFNAAGMGGAANDPYANVDLDLSKVKKVEIPNKPFERKSEEEKMEDKKALGSSKSSLKTTASDHEKAKESKKEVRFGKSMTYQVEGGDYEPSILSEKN